MNFSVFCLPVSYLDPFGCIINAGIRPDQPAAFYYCFVLELFQKIDIEVQDFLFRAEYKSDLIRIFQEKTGHSYDYLCSLFNNVFFMLSQFWRSFFPAYDLVNTGPHYPRQHLRQDIACLCRKIGHILGSVHGRSNYEMKWNLLCQAKEYVDWCGKAKDQPLLELFAAILSQFTEDRENAHIKVNQLANTQPYFPLELLRVIAMISVNPSIVDESICIAAAARLKIHLKNHEVIISDFEKGCIKTLIICLKLLISPDFYSIQTKLGEVLALLRNDLSWHQSLLELILKLTTGAGFLVSHRHAITDAAESIIWKLNDNRHWDDQSFYDDINCFLEKIAASIIEISNQTAQEIDSILSIAEHDASAAAALRSLLHTEFLCHRILFYFLVCGYDGPSRTCWMERSATYLTSKYAHLQQLLATRMMRGRELV